MRALPSRCWPWLPRVALITSAGKLPLLQLVEIGQAAADLERTHGVWFSCLNQQVAPSRSLAGPSVLRRGAKFAVDHGGGVFDGGQVGEQVHGAVVEKAL